MLENWTAEQLQIGLGDKTDPMETVLAEGGPYHVRGHLPAYLEHLRESDRGHWADALRDRFPEDARPR